MFEELLELSIARARRHDGSVAVVCVDLDDFKLVNDSLGHQTGDDVADAGRRAAPRGDAGDRPGRPPRRRPVPAAARRSGARGIGDIDAAVMRAESVAQRIQESLLAPFVVDGTEVYVARASGSACSRRTRPTRRRLSATPESAMWESKKAGPAGFVLSRAAPSTPRRNCSS